MFKGLKDAPTFEQGRFLPEGEYDVKVLKCFVKKTVKYGDAFIAELTVEKSDNPNVTVGSQYTFFQKMVDTTIAFPAIKSFTYAVSGASSKEQKSKVDDKIEQVFEAIAKGEEDLFAGRVARVKVVKKTSKAGKEITPMQFSPL